MSNPSINFNTGREMSKKWHGLNLAKAKSWANEGAGIVLFCSSTEGYWSAGASAKPSAWEKVVYRAPRIRSRT